MSLAKAPESEAPDVLAPRAKQAQKRWFSFSPSWFEISLWLLILNLFVMAGLFWKIESQAPLTIATVSVSQLSRIYAQQIATDPTNSPEMIGLKTRIFTATTEKWLAQHAKQKGMVVFARECVLTGDSVDLTPQVGAEVDKALRSGSLSAEGAGNGILNLKN